jgi:hypothetical protein
MEQGSSWEANSHLASQEIPHLLWNSKVHFRVYKSPPIPRYCVTLGNEPNFCDEELLAPRPAPKLEDG